MSELALLMQREASCVKKISDSSTRSVPPKAASPRARALRADSHPPCQLSVGAQRPACWLKELGTSLSLCHTQKVTDSEQCLPVTTLCLLPCDCHCLTANSHHMGK